LKYLWTDVYLSFCWRR